MKQQTLWDEQHQRLSEKLSILVDKPEETFTATLQALWHMAAGNPKSAEVAAGLELPVLEINQEKRLLDLVGQRLNGTPLAYITGRQQFMGVELLAGPEALIPRKETEILGRAALDILTKMIDQQDKTTLIDVCTGAGNLVVSLATKLPKVRCYASDLSADAVSLARKNVDFHRLKNRVDVREGDLLTPFDNGHFHHQVDVLLCNPPYISSTRVAEMPEEISDHEPWLAFDGGPFGIKILNSLMKEAPRFLKTGGWLVFEVGAGQGDAMVKKMRKSYRQVLTKTDNSGVIRAILAQP